MAICSWFHGKISLSLWMTAFWNKCVQNKFSALKLMVYQWKDDNHIAPIFWNCETGKATMTSWKSGLIWSALKMRIPVLTNKALTLTLLKMWNCFQACVRSVFWRSLTWWTRVRTRGRFWRTKFFHSGEATWGSSTGHRKTSREGRTSKRQWPPNENSSLGKTFHKSYPLRKDASNQVLGGLQTYQ